ncbi:flavin-containing monooxygenase [Cytobacillus sp. FSL R7-0680]|uniref:flavin-containing monooxygenase n=1 Tax=Cytobacillus sp. FSL R7-0680 TaxID=2921689 RepID=UPI0030F977FC
MTQYVDAVVIGAGFSGIYMTYKLHEDGFSVKTFEKAAGVGGVWNVARYPGARCDSDSFYYNFMFSEDLYKKWSWSKRFAGQDEILSYLNFVADELDVRQYMQFNTEVKSAVWNEEHSMWHITTGKGDEFAATYLISGVGCLSTSSIPNFKGIADFQGQSYHTGEWPHTDVNFKGKRVGVIGTGSSGVQSIPVIAETAKEVYVFQRTPQYSVPTRNRSFTHEEVEQFKDEFHSARRIMLTSPSGLPIPKATKSIVETPEEERNTILENAWDKGGMILNNAFNDITINEKSNELVSEFLRNKIRAKIKNPEVAEDLLPYYYYATKRPILDTNYHDTYNQEHVTLVNLQQQPIECITKNGIKTTEKEYPLDLIVFATGYDAMTGTLLKLDIKGRKGLSLRDNWQNGKKVETYLGLGLAGFPNFFTITGPQSPSVLTNVPSAIEQHVEWISDCLKYMRQHHLKTIEPTEDAQRQWSKDCTELAHNTLFTKTASWYTGSNIDGKSSDFLIYLGGLDNYRQICNEVSQQGYKGYVLGVNKIQV